MSHHKKLRRKKHHHPIFKPSPPPPQQEQLSNTWHNNDQIRELLGMSNSTIKRWRASGKLIASKRLGKIFFNDYHVQQLLRDGLPH